MGDIPISCPILFDVREADNATRLRVNRSLKKADAEMIQQSVWESDDYSRLEESAEVVRAADGKTVILEKKGRWVTYLCHY